jgi:hypothetical protein
MKVEVPIANKKPSDIASKKVIDFIKTFANKKPKPNIRINSINAFILFF